MTKNIGIAVTLFIACLLGSCSSKSPKEVETEATEIIPENIVELREDQIKLADIELGNIELRSLSGTLKVNGTVGVAPQNLATVSMPMGGFIRSFSLMPGYSVRKGQTLAQIENQEFINIQQNYLETKNKLEFAKAEFERQSNLYKNEVSSQKYLQQVTSDYKSLKVQMKALEQKLTMIGINPYQLNENNIRSTVSLVSPISGYIKTVNVSIGKSVTESDILFEIVNNDKLFLELTLFEKDADKVKNRQKIRFTINDETEQHEAIIYQTSKSIDSDKTYKVYADVTDRCRNILPGMYVDATIEATSQSVRAVPSEAIVSFDDKDYIFVFEKNKIESGKNFTEYRMVQIQKGVSDNGYTELSFPANLPFKTTKVVIRGAYNLLSAKKNAGEMSC